MTTGLRTEPSAGVRRPTGRRGGDAIRFAFQVLGELLITFGVIVLLFAVYELKVTDYRAAATQHGLSSQLDRQWAGQRTPRPGGPDPVVRPVEGQPFAVLRVPRFGADYSRVVVEGVNHDDLQKGPGHYPGTALPGQVGNVVISGHRTTYGAPFNRADELKPGDPIDVRIAYRTYHYRVTGSRIVSPNESGVLLPVPDQPGARQSGRLLTFTTCNPKYSAKQRLIVFATMRPGDVTDQIG